MARGRKKSRKRDKLRHQYKSREWQNEEGRHSWASTRTNFYHTRGGDSISDSNGRKFGNGKRRSKSRAIEIGIGKRKRRQKSDDYFENQRQEALERFGDDSRDSRDKLVAA